MKVIILLKRRRDLTPTQFRTHYETSHVKLAEKYLGHLYSDYRRNYAVPVEGEHGDAPNPGVADSPYDAVSEMWLKDAAAWTEMLRIISTPEISRILIEDEERFLDRAALRIFTCEEVRSTP